MPAFPSLHSLEVAISTRYSSRHPVAANYSLLTPKGWKAELVWLADLLRMAYPHLWSSISCRSSAGQEKFAGQDWRSNHWANQYKCMYSVVLRNENMYIVHCTHCVISTTDKDVCKADSIFVQMSPSVCLPVCPSVYLSVCPSVGCSVKCDFSAFGASKIN